MIAVDTSVLVAAFVESHPRHEESFRLVSGLRPETACVSCHTVAEFYVTLSRLPGRSASMNPLYCATLARDELARYVSFVALDAPSYQDMITGAAAHGFAGAVIYDALHLAAAAKAGASRFYTWNLGDFTRLSALYPVTIMQPDAA